MAKRIKSSEGGISIPSTLEPATTPTATWRDVPARTISGTATLENTAAEAMEMPVIAAKTAFDSTVATPKPPRQLRIRRAMMANVSRPSPDSLTASPISTKSGTTPKV